MLAQFMNHIIQHCVLITVIVLLQLNTCSCLQYISESNNLMLSEAIVLLYDFLKQLLKEL